MRLLFCLALALLPVMARAEENWSEFRGAAGDGHSRSVGLPLTWDTGKNVRWKTAIHGRGWSSPVVWGRQVWLTTATEDGREMFALCLDRDTGKVLLDRRLFTNANPEPLGNDVNTYASPSPVIEAGRVYLHFGSYGTACLDTKTFKTLWMRRDLPCRHYRGPSSSPVLFGNRLILTFDGADLQYLAALDKRTGKTLWKTNRSAQWDDLDEQGKVIAEGDLRKAHSTPLLVTAGGQPLLISVGAKAGYAYDPRTGKEVWKLPFGGFSTSLRPVAGHGMTYITTGYSRGDLWAVPLRSRGPMQASDIAWKYTRNVPQKPSPLLVGELLFLLHDSGILTCLDAKTGAELWKERIGGTYSASPVCVENRLYCFSEDGRTVVLAPTRAFAKLAESRLSNGFMASPAVAGKAFFLRAKTHLYRIEKSRPDSVAAVRPHHPGVQSGHQSQHPSGPKGPDCGRQSLPEGG